MVWPARWAHRHCSSETNLGSDWSTVMGVRADDIQQAMALCIPAVGESYDHAKATISLERSNSFSWPQGLCPNSPDPFPSLRVGSGDEITPPLLRLLHIKALTAAQSALIVYTSTIHLVTPYLTRTNHYLSLWPPSLSVSWVALLAAVALQTATNMQHCCCICDIGKR